MAQCNHCAIAYAALYYKSVKGKDWKPITFGFQSFPFYCGR